jgi:ABC-type sulfate/molybdate transport systems ATPase subunit
MSETSGFRLENLRQQVGDFTLAADFSLRRGERAALVGKSGIGKTTLLRLIAGLEKPDSGKVFIGDQDVTSWSPQDRRIGFVFQEAALFPSLDVLGNAIFGLLQHRTEQGSSRAEAEKLGMEWLDKVGLSARAHSPVGHLSGGEAQRVAFVRALIWKPQLILLDEPFSALDAEIRQELRQELLRLHEQWPVPLLLVSHDAQDLEALANVRLELQAVSQPGSGASERVVMRAGMGS